MSFAAVTALIVALTGLVAAVGGIIALFRRQAQTAREMVVKVEAVHVLAQKTEKLVNNQLDRQMIYNQQLTGALIAAGIAVPEQERPPGSGEAGERLA